MTGTPSSMVWTEKNWKDLEFLEPTYKMCVRTLNLKSYKVIEEPLLDEKEFWLYIKLYYLKHAHKKDNGTTDN